MYFKGLVDKDDWRKLSFVQFLFDRIGDWPGSLAAEQLFSGIPSRQALDSKTR